MYVQSTRRVKQAPTIRRFLIGAALALAAICGQLLLRGGSVLAGAALLLGCACLFAVLLGRGAPFGPAIQVRDGLLRNRTDRITAFAVAGAVCLAVSAWLLLDVYEPSRTFWRVYFASLFIVTTIPAGVAIAESAGRRPNRKTMWTLCAVAAIVAMAAAVRMAGLSSLPFGTWYDEAANGLEALRIINEPQYRPVYTDGVNASGHYLFLISTVFDLIGVSTRSIRLISALAGVATVAAAYFAGRVLFGPSMGAVLAFMVAVSRWSLTFSRMGMYNAFTPLFELLAVAFLVRALRKNRLSDYVLAGVSFGFGFCYYAAFQLFAVAAGVFLVYVAAVNWRPGSKFWLGLAAMLVATLVITAPIIKFAAERPESYFARVQKTSLFAGKVPDERIPAFTRNLQKHLLMFNVRGDPNGRHNLPGEPMLDPITGALLVLGIALSLAQLRQPYSLFIDAVVPHRAHGRGTIAGLRSAAVAAVNRRAAGCVPARALAVEGAERGMDSRRRPLLSRSCGGNDLPSACALRPIQLRCLLPRAGPRLRVLERVLDSGDADCTTAGRAGPGCQSVRHLAV